MDTTDIDTDAMASWLAFCAPCGRTAAASQSRAPETASRRTGSGRSCTGNNHGGAHRHLLAISAYLHDDVLEVVHVDPFPLVRAPQLDGLSDQLRQQLLRAGGQVANTATINDIISTTIIITTNTTAFTLLILVLLQLLLHLLLFLIYYIKHCNKQLMIFQLLLLSYLHYSIKSIKSTLQVPKMSRSMISCRRES